MLQQAGGMEHLTEERAAPILLQRENLVHSLRAGVAGHCSLRTGGHQG